MRPGLRRRFLNVSIAARLAVLCLLSPACDRFRSRGEPAPAEARPLSTATAAGSAAWLRSTGPPAEWAPNCRLNLGCPAVTPLPTCNGESMGLPVADLARLAPALAGKVVSLRGPLGVKGGLQTMKMCPTAEGERGRACCNSSSSSVIVGALPDAVMGAGSCGGDESAQCCDLPAFGQTVIMTGRLVRLDTWPPFWTIERAKLCQVANNSSKRSN